MAILVNDRLLILEVPKTGTTWIRYALNVLGIKHTFPPASHGMCPRHSIRKFYRDAEIVAATVRHPFDWVQSYYRHHRGVRWKQYESTHPHKRFLPYDRTFEEYVKYMTGESLLDYFESFYPDVWMYTKGLEGCLSVLLERVGVKVGPQRLKQIPLQNVHRDIETPCSKEVKEAFLKAQQPMIDRWFS